MATHTREELDQYEDDELVDLAVESNVPIDTEGEALSDADREYLIAALTESPEEKAEREAKGADLQGAPSPVAGVDLTNVKLEDVGVPDLKEYAKEAGITGYSNMKKAELIDALSRSSAVATVPPPEDQYPLRKSERTMDDPDAGDDPAWAAGLSSLHRASPPDRVHGTFGPKV